MKSKKSLSISISKQEILSMLFSVIMVAIHRNEHDEVSLIALRDAVEIELNKMKEEE